MSITINLEPQKEKMLRERAARRGRDADGYALELLDRLLDEPEQPGMGDAAAPEQPEPTLAALFAGRTGKINSEGRFNYSRNTGRAYAESLLKQQSRLQEDKP